MHASTGKQFQVWSLGCELFRGIFLFELFEAADGDVRVYMPIVSWVGGWLRMYQFECVQDLKFLNSISHQGPC